jgi:3-dehydroquinate synthase
MVLASRLSAELGLVPTTFVDRIERLVARAGLPVSAPRLPLGRWFELMRLDKKAEGGAIRFVVIEQPGRAATRTAPDELVSRVIERHSARA